MGFFRKDEDTEENKPQRVQEENDDEEQLYDIVGGDVNGDEETIASELKKNEAEALLDKMLESNRVVLPGQEETEEYNFQGRKIVNIERFHYIEIREAE